MRWFLLLLSTFSLLSSCKKASYEKTSSGTLESIDSVQYWANIAKDSTTLSLKRRNSLLDKAYNKNILLQSSLKKAKNLSRISLAYLRLKDSLNFRMTNDKLIALSKQIGDKIIQGEAHWDLATFLLTSKPDSSFYHYNEAYSLFLNSESDTDKENVGNLMLSISLLLERNKDYPGAEKEAIAAIKYFEAIKANNRLYQCYNLLGIIQNGLNNHDKALEYYGRAKDYIPLVAEQLQNGYYLQNQNNIASMYLRKADYATALKLFKILEKDALEQNDFGLIHRKIKTGIAISGYKVGALNAEQAIAHIVKSNHVLDSLNDTYNQARTKQFLAEILVAENRGDEAIAAALQAKQIAESTANNDRLLSLLKFLTQIDVKNSTVHAKQYFALNEKLLDEERSIQEKFARISLETSKIEQDNIKLDRQRQLWAAFALIVLVASMATVVIFVQRKDNLRLRHDKLQEQKNQEIYTLMLAQQSRVEEGKKKEQKRISEELHDSVLGQMLGIRLLLATLNKKDDEHSIAQRTVLIDELKNVEEEIRTVSHQLNRTAYDKVDNFIVSIQSLIDNFNTASDVILELDYDDTLLWNRLDGFVKMNSYRIVQESIKNALKHSKCGKVTVDLHKNGEGLFLTISDDGEGFDPKRARKGIGLKNIASRVAKIDATLTIDSKRGEGTKIIVALPFEREMEHNQAFF